LKIHIFSPHTLPICGTYWLCSNNN